MAEYAIVESGGKQYRVEKGASLLVERLPDEQGSKVLLRPVAFRGEKSVAADRGALEKVKVEAVVTEHLRGPKLRVFKHRPKKGYRRRAGHRQELTRLEVTEVRMLTRKPAKKAAARGPQSGERKAGGRAKGRAATKEKSSSTRKSSAAKKKEG
jgi:large subunit ribosomal protein L21